MSFQIKDKKTKMTKPSVHLLILFIGIVSSALSDKPRSAYKHIRLNTVPAGRALRLKCPQKSRMEEPLPNKMLRTMHSAISRTSSRNNSGLFNKFPQQGEPVLDHHGV